MNKGKIIVIASCSLGLLGLMLWAFFAIIDYGVIHIDDLELTVELENSTIGVGEATSLVWTFHTSAEGKTVAKLPRALKKYLFLEGFDGRRTFTGHDATLDDYSLPVRLNTRIEAIEVAGDIRLVCTDIGDEMQMTELGEVEFFAYLETGFHGAPSNLKSNTVRLAVGR